ncbi:MAG: hypothetical protein ACTSWQ_06775, partial [Candidatus Thorarchaeota archaeon]
LRLHCDLITDKSRRDFAKLREALFDNHDIAQADNIYPRICDDIQTQSVMIEVSNELTDPTEDISEFSVSTELLYEAFKKATALPTESILYASGSNTGNSYSIERLVEPKLDKSEIGYASVDLEDSTKALIELEKYGSLMTCFFHAHPGSGINSNKPSATDIKTQVIYENGKFKTIGGIFSRDGYLRFFSDKLDFRVTISGKGVQYVSKNVYKLTELS